MPRVPLVLVVLLLLCGCYDTPDTGSGPGGGGPGMLAGAPAQSFTVTRTDGHSDGLANYRGH
ncbi:MAG: hypothetical protein ABR975_00515, partial [Vulcanimicrobiaceae bacterium]